jgi:hypothetical protein
VQLWAVEGRRNERVGEPVRAGFGVQDLEFGGGLVEARGQDIAGGTAAYDDVVGVLFCHSRSVVRNE